MHADTVVIGGGIIGITIAREIKKRYPRQSVILIEKESEVATHASGRNSGVLHAGFYYTSDSLKARFCREGNRQLREYCKLKQLQLNECGKLVVAKDEFDLEGLDLLYQRGIANGINIEMLSELDAKRIEPRIKTFQRALWSPTTASADPIAVTKSLSLDAEANGVKIIRGCAYIKRLSAIVRTTLGDISTGYIVNAAGLYADRIAKDFGFGNDFAILPFKGLYLYSNEPPGSLKTHVYPVPNLSNPFLGVHFTITVNGKIKIGPTAIPALWRENYKGMTNFNLKELFEILSQEIGLYFNSGFKFNELVKDEVKKNFQSYLVKLAAQLLNNVHANNYHHWGQPGIRAQLLNKKDKKLIMDFIVEGDRKSMHILNAVSPAWTCSMSFAEFIVDQIDKKMLRA